MKKIALVISALALTVAFTSCKKDYTCTCKDTAGTTVISYPLTKTKKKTAKDACTVWDNAMKAGGGGSCSL